jgi:transcriptional regulator with XRE-family HTH domain
MSTTTAMRPDSRPSVERPVVQHRPQDFDRALAQRIRTLREEQGMTQMEFAAEIGVTYQQAHKYEKGINRVSGGRLYSIARALGVPVAELLDGLDDKPVKETASRRHVQDMLRAYLTLPEGQQRALRELAYALNHANDGRG